MPGDDWQKFANLRVLFGYMYAQPGKKLIFMGGELGQWAEWAHDRQIDWHLGDEPRHGGLRRWLQDLNRLYRAEAALHTADFSSGGFEWIDCNDSRHSTISLIRRSSEKDRELVVVFNFTPVPRHNYRIGVSRSSVWEEVLNSDARGYGGSGQGNLGTLEPTPVPFHGRSHSLNLTLPPLAALFLRPSEERP
jgi:1,4-alpha-glucan branching enzyme